MDILYGYSCFLSTYYSDTTKDTYVEQVKMFFNFLKEYKGGLNNIIIYNIDRKDIYNYLAYISNYAKGTKKVKISAIKNFYSYLDKDRAIFLFEDIKLYGYEERLPKYLTKGEINDLLNFYDGEKQDIIFLFLTLGIRLSEMTQINFKNINYDENYLIIMQKGGRERKVYFSNNTKRYFAEILQISL